ncbi:MAG: hypothetical protein JWQ97_1988 [Phenylobacterium sp.]|nr:hypothetical protein [Phenylobacterium sp.]
MKLVVVAALAALALPGLALAAPLASALTASPTAAAPAAGQSIRVGLHRETLPPGGKLPETRSEGLRYLLVVSGKLKVSDLVTGEEQLVEPGKMAAEQPGDWCLAQAVGPDPVTLYVIERTPGGPASAANGGEN